MCERGLVEEKAGCGEACGLSGGEGAGGPLRGRCRVGVLPSGGGTRRKRFAFSIHVSFTLKWREEAGSWRARLELSGETVAGGDGAFHHGVLRPHQCRVQKVKGLLEKRTPGADSLLKRIQLCNQSTKRIGILANASSC